MADMRVVHQEAVGAEGFTYSRQSGIPGHCLVAQVFGPDGKSIASIDPTENPAVATNRARILALTLNFTEGSS